MNQPEVIAVIGAILTLLLSGNIYFVKRLVDKVEKTGEGQIEVKESFAQLSQTVAGVGNQLREIKLDIKELRRIEIEVAVLRAHLNPTTASKGS